MNSFKLKVELSGDGYEQRIKIKISEKDIIYDGFADHLITSVNQRLEFKLNWGIQKCICNYEIKKTSNYIVLMPRIIPEKCFDLRSKSIMIFDFQDIAKLWNILKYDTSELDDIFSMNNNDWSLLWLLNIEGCLKTLQIEKLADWTIEQILAEEPDENPKISDIVRLISLKTINFSESSFCNLNNLNPVVAYIENIENEIFEWSAIDSSNRCRLMLGNDWSIEYTVGV